VEFAQTNASHPWLPTRRYGITQGYQSVVLFGGELPDTDGRELPGSADLPSERCSLVLVGEMGAGRHEALLYSLTGDHVYKVLYGRFGLRLGNLFVVKVLDNFNRRVRFSSERGYGGLVVEVLGISIPAAGLIASAYAFGAKRYAADAGWTNAFGIRVHGPEAISQKFDSIPIRHGPN